MKEKLFKLKNRLFTSFKTSRIPFLPRTPWHNIYIYISIYLSIYLSMGTKTWTLAGKSHNVYAQGTHTCASLNANWIYSRHLLLIFMYFMLQLHFWAWINFLCVFISKYGTNTDIPICCFSSETQGWKP